MKAFSTKEKFAWYLKYQMIDDFVFKNLSEFIVSVLDTFFPGILNEIELKYYKNTKATLTAENAR